MSMLTGKRVFLDDCLIGDAATWSDVRALLKARGILFIGGLRGAEGPTGFYVSARPVQDRAPAWSPETPCGEA